MRSSSETRYFRITSENPTFDENYQSFFQPGSSVRTFVLCVYALVNIIVTAALILLVVMAPTR